jgi:hypothetical protein
VETGNFGERTGNLTYKIPIITHQGFGDFCEWPFLSDFVEKAGV